MEENTYLLNDDKPIIKRKKIYCLSTMYYLVYFIYNVTLFGMLTVNTYYTINLSDDIKNDTHEITDKLNYITDVIKHYINDTIY